MDDFVETDEIPTRAHAICVDARGAPRRLGNHRSGDEPPLWNRAEIATGTPFRVTMMV